MILTGNSLILAEVMQAAGIRAFVGKLSMDISSRPSYVEPSAEESIKAAASFAEKCSSLVSHLPPHKRLVEPVITPRFVPTCSNDLLAKLGRLSEERNLRIQSHMAEAHDQMQWVERERGMSDIDAFDNVGRIPTSNEADTRESHRTNS
jgi:guanine deaminase